MWLTTVTLPQCRHSGLVVRVQLQPNADNVAYYCIPSPSAVIVAYWLEYNYNPLPTRWLTTVTLPPVPS